MISLKMKRDLGMASHTPPLEKQGNKNKGKCHYTCSLPSSSEDVEFTSSGMIIQPNNCT